MEMTILSAKEAPFANFELKPRVDKLRRIKLPKILWLINSLNHQEIRDKINSCWKKKCCGVVVFVTDGRKQHVLLASSILYSSPLMSQA